MKSWNLRKGELRLCAFRNFAVYLLRKVIIPYDKNAEIKKPCFGYFIMMHPISELKRDMRKPGSQ